MHEYDRQPFNLQTFQWTFGMCPLRSGLQRHILYLGPGLHVLSWSRRIAGHLEPKCQLELIDLPAGYSFRAVFQVYGQWLHFSGCSDGRS